MERGDEELLCGGADEFAALFRRHEDAVLGFFLRRVGRAELAADLAAETFAALLAGRARFDPSLGDVRGWLFGIARNVLAKSLEAGRVDDAMRRRLGMEPLELYDEDLARIDELGATPALAALDALPDDQAHAIKGHVLEQRSYTDLAIELECSQSVVRQRVSRGLRTLRDTLGETS